ncbi:hypothetical protein [Cylindrospermum sp. FACHB-282]|nr:hypothetical protein [Cylindrospermum sp. FACHB-282]
MTPPNFTPVAAIAEKKTLSDRIHEPTKRYHQDIVVSPCVTS